MLNDRALMVRVEDAIATERSTFADGMAACYPDTKAAWLPVAGGRAVFTGAGFFSNRALGLGIHCGVSGDDLARVEAFYAERGQRPAIEIASTVDRSLIELLGDRGYRMVRFHSLYAQTLSAAAALQPREAGPEIREVRDDATAQLWSRVLLDGFGYTAELDRGRVSRWNRMLRSLPNLSAFVATRDGRAVGAASVLVDGDTAVLGGAATLPSHRRRGVQQALIRARLAHVAGAGCRLAVGTADPGSTSGRNAERAGFGLAGTHLALRQ